MSFLVLQTSLQQVILTLLLWNPGLFFVGKSLKFRIDGLVAWEFF